MPKEKTGNRFRLPSVDDLFSSAEEREQESMTSGKILDIPISEIDDFPEHPFRVEDNAEMDALVASVKEHGVIEPATVRKKDDGRYEMISGHRRKHASIRLGLQTIRCEVVELTREEAVLQMVESNLHREHILPSEKAFAYKMRLEAMNRQGKRSDLTSTPLVSKSRTNEELGAEVGESREQIRRYIRLTELIPEILDMVDNSVLKEKNRPQMALRPAVEISYLKKDEQKALLELMEINDCTPSHAQTIAMKLLSQDGELTADRMEEIVCMEKPNQKIRFELSEKILSMLPPKVRTDSDGINEYLEKAVSHYEKMLARKKEKDLNIPL